MYGLGDPTIVPVDYVPPAPAAPGALRLQPKGYSIIGGGANYYEPSAADRASNAVGLPQNCVGTGGQQATNLPANGETCFMLEFPFVGKKQYGCGSEVIQGGYGNPYVECVPLILQGGSFDFISPLLRIAGTAATAWFLWSMFGGHGGR